tara:strand:+ start:1483 stop:2724 length:1242 start_codon:yes stop_codon:yes gene_type:complete
MFKNKNVVTSVNKDNNEIKYYPNVRIGKGGYKSVYNLIPESQKDKINNDYLTLNEREELSVNINENKEYNNMVIITPNKKEENNRLVEVLLDEKKKDAFENEFKLQQYFSKKKLAPEVLEIGENSTLTKNIKKRKSDNNGYLYKVFALTYRCEFNMCQHDYKKIQNNLKILFNKISQEGYIYTDIKQGNICQYNLLNKNTKSNDFVFVDFDENFIFKYDGFYEKLPKTFKNIYKYEIISDIMEFMFLIIELFICGSKKLNCKFCNNTKNIINQVQKIIKKYENKEVPMISRENKNTLLMLDGSKIPFMTPLEILNYYLKNYKEKKNNIVLYNSIQKILNSDNSSSISNLNVSNKKTPLDFKITKKLNKTIILKQIDQQKVKSDQIEIKKEHLVIKLVSPKNNGESGVIIIKTM